MRILLLSDLHISPGSDQNTFAWVTHFCNFMKSTYDRETFLFVLGDVIEGGTAAAFNSADRIFSHIESELAGVPYKIAFLPGNQDSCDGSLKPFTRFCREHQTLGANTFDFSRDSVWNHSIGKFNFISADSLHGRNYGNPGSLDLEEIRRCICPQKTNVLLTHHSLLFEDDSDHTGVINQGAVFHFLAEQHIDFVFHGHVHAMRSYSCSEQGWIFGVGSMRKGLSGLVNEDEQFLELQIHGPRIEAVMNWLWRGGEEQYNRLQLYPDGRKHYAGDALRLKKDCPEPEGYIERFVMPRSLATADEVTRYFGWEKRIPLLEACQAERLVLLIADAGLGKTLEMEHLAHCCSRPGSNMLPLLIPLKRYNGMEIQKYIDFMMPDYKTLDPAQFLLIMDGYDELSHPEVFRQAIDRFAVQNPQTHICISMRSNFLSSIASAFRSYAVYQLLELSSRDIEQELQTNGIDKLAFLRECRVKELNNLIPNPFYLQKLILAYPENSVLPKLTKLMGRILDQQFEKDASKFEYAQRGLEECQHEAKRALTKLAMGMQLLNCTVCDEKSFQAILERQDRQYIKLSSLTICTPQGHSFSHNIFKEYLAAQYISQLGTDEIIKYIQIPDTEYLNPNWFNVIGFITQLNQSEQLRSWLLHAGPLSLARLEPAYANEALRYSVLKIALSDIVEKNVWFRDEVCSEAQLAAFSQSSRAVDLLLAHIARPAHFRSLYFCLSVLGKFSNLFGKESEVRAALVNCYQENQVRPHEKRGAVSDIAALHLNTPEILEDVITRFGESPDSYERLGLYEYILLANQENETVDVLLAGIRHVSSDEDGMQNATERFTLIDCLKNINGPRSIQEVIDWCAQKDNSEFDFYQEEDLLSALFDEARDDYNSGLTSLYESVYAFFVSAVREYARPSSLEASTFFVETGTEERALIQLSHEEAEDQRILLEDALQLQSSLIDTFCRLYSEDKLQDPSVFRQYAEGLCRENDAFKKCAAALWAKTGKVLPIPPPQIDYEQERQADAQAFFDCLFDPGNMRGLLAKLITLCHDPNITFSELHKQQFLRYGYPAGTRALKLALIQSGFQEERIADFFEIVHWDAFVLNRICNLFKNGQTVSALHIDDEQHRVLHSIYKKLEAKLDYHTVCKEGAGNGLSISFDFTYYQIFKDALRLPAPDEHYIGLLEIPYFGALKNSTSNKKYDLIEEHITPQEIAKHIEVLARTETRVYTLDDLMVGCRRYHIHSCKDVAIRFCKRYSVSAHARESALEYLFELFGSEVILTEVMPLARQDFFERIVDVLHATRDERLTAKMLRMYRRSKSPLLLKTLIAQNSVDGLKWYLSACKKVNGSMDRTSADDGITKAVGAIRDITLLPLLLKAVKLCFSKSFQDGRFYTLQGSLQKALQACAQSEFQRVWEAMEHLKGELSGTPDAVSFCNVLQRELLESDKASRIKNWSVFEVENLLRTVM